MTPRAIADLMARAYVWQSPWSAQAVADSLSRPTVRMWTRDQGVLIAQVVAGEAEILALAVDPQVQRQGLARGLVTQCHADLAAQGTYRILLEVAAPNAPAIGLYHAMGYAEVGRRRGYYLQPDGSRVDAIVMDHALAPMPDPAPGQI